MKDNESLDDISTRYRKDLDHHLGKLVSQKQRLSDEIDSINKEISMVKTLLGSEKETATTLHLAIAAVLHDSSTESLRAPDIRTEIGARGLYLSGEGGLPSVNQIHSRIRRYKPLFDRVGKNYQLRHHYELATGPLSEGAYDLFLLTARPRDGGPSTTLRFEVAYSTTPELARSDDPVEKLILHRAWQLISRGLPDGSKATQTYTTTGWSTK